jgi:hypothetical protein
MLSYEPIPLAHQIYRPSLNGVTFALLPYFISFVCSEILIFLDGHHIRGTGRESLAGAKRKRWQK